MTSRIVILILIIAHDLKLFRKREKLFVFPIRNKILHDIFWNFSQNMRVRDGEQLIDLTAVNFIRFSNFLTETILQFDSTMEI